MTAPRVVEPPDEVEGGHAGLGLALGLATAKPFAQSRQIMVRAMVVHLKTAIVLDTLKMAPPQRPCGGGCLPTPRMKQEGLVLPVGLTSRLGRECGRRRDDPAPRSPS